MVAIRYILSTAATVTICRLIKQEIAQIGIETL